MRQKTEDLGNALPTAELGDLPPTSRLFAPGNVFFLGVDGPRCSHGAESSRMPCRPTAGYCRKLMVPHPGGRTPALGCGLQGTLCSAGREGSAVRAGASRVPVSVVPRMDRLSLPRRRGCAPAGRRVSRLWMAAWVQGRAGRVGLCQGLPRK